MSTTAANPFPAGVPAPAPATFRTVADLIESLGGIPGHRVRLVPAPGTATVQDVIDADAHEDRLCELVDGVLVEKPMGLRESLIAMYLGERFGAFVRPRNLGLVAGEAGMMRILPGLVRMPDVSYLSWTRLPHGKVSTEPVPAMAPDLAVEVLSESNTRAEMDRKRREYFEAGCQLVWQLDPETRTAEVFRSGQPPVRLAGNDVLTGEEVLPGFSVVLSDVFSVLDQKAPP